MKIQGLLSNVTQAILCGSRPGGGRAPNPGELHVLTGSVGRRALQANREAQQVM